jgi:hypothetical protein
VGRNSKAKRDAKRKAALRGANRGAGGHGAGGGLAGLPGGFGAADGEGSTLAMYGMAWDNLDPRKGTCDGPLIVHEDGGSECHGPCDSAMGTWHPHTAVELCPGSVTDLWHACPRCFEVAAVSPDLQPGARCPGTQIDHADGSTTCTDDVCPGDGAFHATGMSCGFMGEPCQICA